MAKVQDRIFSFCYSQLIVGMLLNR
jgi:hypothetical protein